MSETDFDAEDWTRFVSDMNDAFLTGIERNVNAQAELIETWAAAMEHGFEDTAETAEAIESYANAYRIWLDAAETQYEEFIQGLETGEIPTEDLRDRWLAAANDAFTEVMQTTAFAHLAGQTMEDILEAQRQATETSEETLTALGFASRSDVLEVGERLVELERRQHTVERKLDEVLRLLEAS